MVFGFVVLLGWASRLAARLGLKGWWVLWWRLHQRRRARRCPRTHASARVWEVRVDGVFEVFGNAEEVGVVYVEVDKECAFHFEARQSPLVL